MKVGGEEYSCWGFVGALLNWEQVPLPSKEGTTLKVVTTFALRILKYTR